MSKYFGIDFGTTTTAFVCFDENGQRYDIGDQEGQPFRSIIVIDKMTGKVKDKGTSAWRKRLEYELDGDQIVIGSIKKQLKEGKSWRAGDILWTDVTVSSEILKQGVDEILRRWPEVGLPFEAVVAVPVGFHADEREKIAEAARSSGIVIKQFVSEPTAALIGCKRDLANVRHAMVFDWGGGTLDVSVMQLSEGTVTELAKDGAPIGGDILDELFAHWLHHQHQKNHCDLPLFDAIGGRAKDSIRTISEIGKCRLSDKPEIDVILRDYCGQVLNEVVDQTMLEGVIGHKVDEAIAVAMRALQLAGRSQDEIDLVLLTGGSSKIPLVIRRMDELFGASCKYPEDAEWCIARGAARLARHTGSYVLSKSIGVVLGDNYSSFLPVLRSGEPIDHKSKTITLGLVEDSSEARLVLAESFADSLSVSGHRVFDILTIPAAGFNMEPIEVNFKIEKNLSLTLSVANKFYGERSMISKKYTHLKFEYLLEG